MTIKLLSQLHCDYGNATVWKRLRRKPIHRLHRLLNRSSVKFTYHPAKYCPDCISVFFRRMRDMKVYLKDNFLWLLKIARHQHARTDFETNMRLCARTYIFMGQNRHFGVWSSSGACAKIRRWLRYVTLSGDHYVSHYVITACSR